MVFWVNASLVNKVNLKIWWFRHFVKNLPLKKDPCQKKQVCTQTWPQEKLAYQVIKHQTASLQKVKKTLLKGNFIILLEWSKNWIELVWEEAIDLQKWLQYSSTNICKSVLKVLYQHGLQIISLKNESDGSKLPSSGIVWSNVVHVCKVALNHLFIDHEEST